MQLLSDSTYVNRLLQLHGDDSYVLLPRNVFNTLSEATVEAWVKWQRLTPYSQPFGFGKTWRVMGISTGAVSDDLQFFIYPKYRTRYVIKVPHIIRTNQWYHLACVTGKMGMRLYLNGVLVGAHDYTGSFASLGDDVNNYIGKSHWQETAGFCGQVDELRIWRIARTAEQIQHTLPHRLSGHEPHLVGLWNFDQEDASDASRFSHHGEMVGRAHCLRVMDSLSGSVILPSVIQGRVTNEAGDPLANAVVRLEQSGVPVVETRTDTAGYYRMVVDVQHQSRLSEPQPVNPYDLAAHHDLLGAWQRTFSLRPGERKQVHLVLEKAISIEGDVLAYDRTPHPPLLVQLLRVERETAKEVPVATTKSDEGGRYRFVNLMPGVYKVRCHTADTVVYFRREGASGYGAERLKVRDGGTLTGVDLRFAPGQMGVWRHYSYFDGLADNQVSAVAYDSDGMLWFGTGNGVSRFDGETFTHYTTKDGLAHHSVRAVFCARDGHLWLGTWGGGVSHFDGDRFRTYTPRDGLAHANVLSIHQDGDGHLWFATAGGGVSCFDGQAFTTYTTKRGLGHDVVRAICHDQNGMLWFATDGGGLSRFDGTQFHTYTTQDGLAHHVIYTLYCDSRGVLWAGTAAGLCRFDGERFTCYTTKDGLADDVIWAVGGVDDAMWVVTQGGMSHYDGTRFYTHLAEALDQLKRIHANTGLCCDSEGGFWLGGTDGVWHFETQVAATLSRKDGLAGDRVRAIHRDDNGDLWFGTWGGGVSRFDGKRFHTYTVREGLAHNDVSVICRDQRNHLWFGTWGGGVSRFDGMRFVTYTHVDGLLQDRIGAMQCNSDGDMLFAMDRFGVSRFDGRQFVDLFPPDALPFGNQQVRDICCGARRELWMATSEGVVRYDGVAFTRLTTEDGLMAGAVQAVYVDSTGVLWIGTDVGLSCFDGGHLVNHTAADGLPYHHIHAIYEDTEGKIWAATLGGGAICFDGNAWTSLDTRDGLPDNLVYSIEQGADGCMWFGTQSGVTQYRRSSVLPSIRIVSVQLDVRYTDTETLPPVTLDSRVSIDYTAIDFKTLPSKRQYRWRLTPLADPCPEQCRKWSQATSATRFEWTPQHTGPYRFEVQAIDRDLNYSQPAQVLLEVVPQPGEAVLRQTREELETAYRELADSNAQLEEAKLAAETANRAKSLFLANMSHDIRTPMNAILGYAQILQRDASLSPEHHRVIDTIDSSGRHLLALINDILDLAKIEAGRMEYRATDFDLQTLLRDLDAIFRLRCQQAGLTWHLHGSLETPCLVRGDAAKLGQVLLNLLTNAVKFTETGGVRLHVTPHHGNRYRFEVVDTGMGVAPEIQEAIFEPFYQGTQRVREQGAGLGLAIVKEYLTLMNGVLELETSPQQGSRFLFELILPPAQHALAEGDGMRGKHPVVLALGCRVKALVVDDTETNRDVLAKMLVELGVEVVEAANGAEAMARARHDVFDIVYMDMQMPGMDGLQTAEQMWERFGRDRFKMVAVTAAVLAHEQKRLAGKGFDAFLGKPFGIEQVAGCMADLLQVAYDDAVSSDSTESVHLSPVVLAQITLPEALYRNLQEAAELRGVTRLTADLEQVGKLGPRARVLADHLRHLCRNYDLDGVLAILENIKHA